MHMNHHYGGMNLSRVQSVTLHGSGHLPQFVSSHHIWMLPLDLPISDAALLPSLLPTFHAILVAVLLAVFV